MSATDFLPYPYFKVDKDFIILSASKLAQEQFASSEQFLSLIDDESKGKAVQVLGGSVEREETELVMHTNDSPVALFTVSIQWENEVGHVICIEKDSQIADLTALVQKHRHRLAETDFELLERKEEVEQAILKIQKLSCPFITLTSDIALIPLFGNINHRLIAVNQERLLNSCYTSEYEQILIDFNGVGELTNEGVNAFRSLVKQFNLLGLQCFVIGLKPSHVFYLNDYKAELGVSFAGSLSEVLAQLN
ncbi:hypothetical protein LC040_18540 [Bacillus tianshenii]|nr:hypothetical protein LC040_18540 [Bacillus tianshenii]